MLKHCGRFRWSLSALVAALALGAHSAAAGTITYVTQPGETVPDGAVDAKVEFILGNGTMTIVLTSLQANPTSSGQNLSGLAFSVSGLTGNGSLATVNSGLITDIDSGGAYTVGVSDPLTRWKASHTADDVVLTALTGGQPDHMIIGPDDHGGFDPSLGKYTHANPSITNRDPSVLGSATFVITMAGVTEDSVLNDVSFRFGSQGLSRQGVLTAAPEPSSIVLASCGALILGAMLRRRSGNA